MYGNGNIILSLHNKSTEFNAQRTLINIMERASEKEGWREK